MSELIDLHPWFQGLALLCRWAFAFWHVVICHVRGEDKAEMSRSTDRLLELISTKQPSLTDRLLRGGLWIASGLYGFGVMLRNRSFDWRFRKINRVSGPVICIGNITTGGTGKTPMVAWIARWFRDQQVRVAIVSRGYGATEGSVNDEALELELQLPDVPHVQNRDRTAAAQVAFDELAAQVVLLDDGFQHRRLARDLDILLLDATNPFGFGFLLPRGLLREPLWGLSRASLIILSRANFVDQAEIQRIEKIVRRWNTSAPWILAEHRPQELVCFGLGSEPLEQLQGRKVTAFCGIGNPDAFFRTLCELGVHLVATRALEDHCVYDREQVADLQAWLGQLREADCVICTMKDLVKLRCDVLGGKKLLALKIGIAFRDGESILVESLTALKASLPEDPW